MKTYVDAAGLQEYTTKLVARLKQLFPGTPLAASTVAGMTDTSRIYVYTGSETGYTAGNWYYWDGTAWVSGGVYQAAAVVTDATLSETGKAADAGTVGELIAPHVAAGMTAPANITAGEYVLAAGTLYRALSNIASGATLTANGNVVAVTIGGELFTANTLIAQKADVHGVIDNARQLVSNVGVEDQVPYNFRTSGGSADIGDRETDMIVGGTVAWNQLLNADSDFSATSGATITSTVDRVATFTATAEGQQAYKTFRAKPGHIYIGVMTYKTSVATTDVVGRFNRDIPGKATTEWQSVFNIYLHGQNSAEAGRSVGIKDLRTSGWDAIQVKEFQAFDLTQMFGTTIADYIYSLEQANAGDGVAWFKKLFPLDYYAYDAGTLRSVQTSAHKMVGFNAYDNASGTARLLGGMEYQISGTYTALAYTDVSGNAETITPDADGYFTPGANGTLTVTGGNSTTTCVHLVWDGERDGEYEPYQAWNYPLDDSLTLRGVPTLDANNKLRYDGDTYESDGTVTRRYEMLALDGVTAGKKISTVGQASTGEQAYYGTVTLQNTAKGRGKIIANAYFVCTGLADPGDIYINGNGTMIYLLNRDQTITTADAWNTWLQSNDVVLLYEIATPTTETADPYQNPQIVSDWGTEEYVDAGVEAGTRDVAIPVGHDTFYQANLRAKLEMSPDSPAGDGDYIVRQENGQNVYVPLVIPAELPTVPETDGTYTLRITVADGTPTIAWVADT